MTLDRRPDWRDRLRVAIDRSGKKHSAVAREAGIAPETLSRILNAAQVRPAFQTVARIAQALNVRVGWLLDEPVRGVEFTEAERRYPAVRRRGPCAARQKRLVSANNYQIDPLPSAEC